MTQWCHITIGLHSCCLRGQVRNSSGSLTKQSWFTSLPGKTIVAFVVVPNPQVEMFFTVFYQRWRARVALQCVCTWTFLVLRTTSLDYGFKPDQNLYQWAKSAFSITKWDKIRACAFTKWSHMCSHNRNAQTMSTITQRWYKPETKTMTSMEQLRHHIWGWSGSRIQGMTYLAGSGMGWSTIYLRLSYLSFGSHPQYPDWRSHSCQTESLEGESYLLESAEDVP